MSTAALGLAGQWHSIDEVLREMPRDAGLNWPIGRHILLG
ncbi:MAG: hypothetical protein ACI9U2_002047 [Bradymonadia bacterium]